MPDKYLCGAAVASLLGLTGIILAALGTNDIPTSLTRDEMYNTPTGLVCSPELCSQMLTQKQRASEGVKLSIIGGSLFAFSLFSVCVGFVHMTYCSDRPRRRVRPIEPVVVSEATLVGSVGITPVIVSEQTVPRLTHSPSTTGAPQPTSSANGPQELPPP